MGSQSQAYQNGNQSGFQKLNPDASKLNNVVAANRSQANLNNSRNSMVYQQDRQESRFNP